MPVIKTGTSFTVKPTLNLDFARDKQLDPRITFTRASNATYYDGYTSVKAEENLFDNSTDYTNLLSIQGASITTTTGVTDPQGGTNAITLSNIANNEYVYKQSSLIKAKAGETYTASVYIKGTASEIVGVRLFRVDGTIENSNTTLTLDGTWQRVELSLTLQYNHDRLRLDAGRVAGGNASSFSLAFPQMEKRSAATAYTPTTNIPIIKYQPVLQTAGNNVARFDHNPITGESLGLLMEEQRTNLVTYSEDLSTNWTAYSTTDSNDNVAIAPDGTNIATEIFGNAGLNVSFLYNIPSISAGTYTFSAYVKKGFGGGEIFLIDQYDVGGGDNSGRNRILINLSTLTVTAINGSSSTLTTEDVGNGWYRFSIRYVTTNPVATQFRLGCNDNDGLEKSVLVWGAQLEQKSFLSSYIKTTGTTATRSADAALMTNIQNSEWFKQGQGTLYAESNKLQASTNYESIVQLSDGTVFNRPELGLIDNKGYQNISTNGGTVANWTQSNAINISTYPPGVFAKAALGYETNNAVASIIGRLGTVDTSLTIPFCNTLKIGNDNYNRRLNGNIKKIVYYPVRLSNNELQILTSGDVDELNNARSLSLQILDSSGNVVKSIYS